MEEINNKESVISDNENFEVIQHKTTTRKSAVIPGLTIGCDDPQTLKIKDLSNHLKVNLISRIPGTYIKQSVEERDVYDAHRVLIGSTRISTFFVFSDGKHIAIFDRTQNREKTEVGTDRYDMFGAVQFENKSMLHSADPKKNKIQSEVFAEAQILNWENIPGFAIEENIKGDADLAIMYGLYIEVSEKDLKTINFGNENILILNLNDLSSRVINNATCKAELAFQYMKSRENKLGE